MDGCLRFIFFWYHLILLLCKTWTSNFFAVWGWICDDCDGHDRAPHLSQHSCTIYPFLRGCYDLPLIRWWSLMNARPARSARSANREFVSFCVGSPLVLLVSFCGLQPAAMPPQNPKAVPHSTILSALCLRDFSQHCLWKRCVKESAGGIMSFVCSCADIVQVTCRHREHLEARFPLFQCHALSLSLWRGCPWVKARAHLVGQEWARAGLRYQVHEVRVLLHTSICLRTWMGPTKLPRPDDKVMLSCL